MRVEIFYFLLTFTVICLSASVSAFDGVLTRQVLEDWYTDLESIESLDLSKKNIKGNDGAHSICGTPEYLAPEILFKEGHGKACDWYILFCEAITL